MVQGEIVLVVYEDPVMGFRVTAAETVEVDSGEDSGHGRRWDIDDVGSVGGIGFCLFLWGLEVVGVRVGN